MKVKTFSTDKFPKDYKRNHFIILGPSGSGKTYYTKYIVSELKKSMIRGGCDEYNCPIHVFVGTASVDNWLKPEKNGDQLVNSEYVYTQWNSDNRNKVKNTAIENKNDTYTKGRGLVIFDDAKDLLNFHGNDHFKNWIRTLRNDGIQMIVIGHTPKDVPPVARDGNIKNILLFQNSNKNTLRELAEAYADNDIEVLVKLMKNLEKNSMIKISLEEKTIGVHKAPPPSLSGFDTYGLGSGSDSDSDEGGGGGYAIGSRNQYDSSLGGGTKGIGSIDSNRNINVNGVYNDASDNSVKIHMAQKFMETNTQIINDTKRLKASLENEKIRRIHKKSMEELDRNEELKTLLLSSMLYGGDRHRCALLLSQCMGTPIDSTEIFDGYDKIFMNSYYPSIPYNRDSSSHTADAITRYGDLGCAVFSGDKGGIFKSLLGHVNKPLKQLLGKGENNVVKRSSRDVIIEKVKKAIVYRQNRHKGEMNIEDEKQIRAFMKPLYPDENIDGFSIYYLIRQFLNEHCPSEMKNESPYLTQLCLKTRHAILNRDKSLSLEIFLYKVDKLLDSCAYRTDFKGSTYDEKIKRRMFNFLKEKFPDDFNNLK